MSNNNIHNLDDLLDEVDRAAQDGDELSIEGILKVIGRRSFGPILLFAGLVTLAPIVGDIPGVPTLIGLLLLLVAMQLLFQREHIWLPDWLLKRSVSKDKAVKAIGWSRKPARFTDKFLQSRLTQFVDGPGFFVVAGCGVLIAALLPLMEVVPFSANAAGAALTALGLALIARDGLWAIIAMGIVLSTVGFLIYYFFF